MKKTIMILVLISAVFVKAQYTRQPRQYGEYIQPYNLDLTERVLQKKQNDYNNNYSIVKNYLDNLHTLIKIKVKYVKLSEGQYSYLENVIKNMNSIKSADLSSNSTANDAISYIKKSYNQIDSW